MKRCAKKHRGCPNYWSGAGYDRMDLLVHLSDSKVYFRGLAILCRHRAFLSVGAFPPFQFRFQLLSSGHRWVLQQSADGHAGTERELPGLQRLRQHIVLQCASALLVI